MDGNGSLEGPCGSWWMIVFLGSWSSPMQPGILGFWDMALPKPKSIHPKSGECMVGIDEQSWFTLPCVIYASETESCCFWFMWLSSLRKLTSVSMPDLYHNLMTVFLWLAPCRGSTLTLELFLGNFGDPVPVSNIDSGESVAWTCRCSEATKCGGALDQVLSTSSCPTAAMISQRLLQKSVCRWGYWGCGQILLPQFLGLRQDPAHSTSLAPRSWVCTSNSASTSISQLGRLRERSMHWWTTLSWSQAGHPHNSHISGCMMEMGMVWKRYGKMVWAKTIQKPSSLKISQKSSWTLFCYSPLGGFWRCFDPQPIGWRKLTGGVDGIAGINIIAYEPAFGIIGDPAKKDPKTRQLLGLLGIIPYCVSLAGITSKQVQVPLFYHDRLAVTS